MSESKAESVLTAVEASSFPEFETREIEQAKTTKMVRLVESARLGLTVLALLSAVVIVGTAAETLGVYNKTSLGEEYFLALWPSDFDIRPTIALITCGAIVVLISAISLAVAKIPAIQKKPFLHSSLSLLFPVINLIAGLTGTSFFYGVNASSTTNSLHSWSCQWSSIDMNMQPYWGTLCKESKVALYLTIVLIPLQVIILGTVAFESFVSKKTAAVHERKGSPTMS